MSDPTHQERPRPARPARVGTLSILGMIALVLAALSSVSLVIVLIAALMGQVLWGGFTIFPAIFFPVAFMLMCVELARTALRRRRRWPRPSGVETVQKISGNVSVCVQVTPRH